MCEASCFTPTVFELQEEMKKTAQEPSLSGVPSSLNIMLKDFPCTISTDGKATQHLGILNKYPSIPLPAARMLVMLSQLRGNSDMDFLNQNEIGFAFQSHYLMARDSTMPRVEYAPGRRLVSTLQDDLLDVFHGDTHNAKTFDYSISELLAHPVKGFSANMIKDSNLPVIMLDLASQIATASPKTGNDFSRTLISFAKTLWIMDGKLIQEGMMLMHLVESGNFDIKDNRIEYWKPIYDFFRFHLQRAGMKAVDFIP